MNLLLTPYLTRRSLSLTREAFMKTPRNNIFIFSKGNCLIISLVIASPSPLTFFSDIFALACKTQINSNFHISSIVRELLITYLSEILKTSLLYFSCFFWMGTNSFTIPL